jgi:predicted PurR-regulated permease PerM
MTPADQPPPPTRGVATRSRGKLLALAAATVLALYVAFLLVQPFLPPLVWAVTIAVITHRFSQWVGRKTQSANWKAAICTLVTAVAILLPATVVVVSCVQQIGSAVEQLQSEEFQKQMTEWVEGHPRLQKSWDAVSKEFDLAKEAPQIIDRMRSSAMAVVSAPIYFAVQLLLTLFVLFYLYRDEEDAIDGVRSVMPLSEAETTRLLRRIDDTIHATVYGTLTVALVQGAMGGLIFLVLGIPGAVLWGTIMGLLAIIPYLGTFVIWGPTALFLAAQGDWGKAAILVGWGALAIGLIDNLLYPMLVGQRLRQHTVIAFIAILGGIAVFGTPGVILGPVAVTVLFFLLDVWRRRTEDGASAERA